MSIHSSCDCWSVGCTDVQAYNPINYLRNVAVNNSRTPFTFYVDVDLVPNPALYDSLRRRLGELQHTSRPKIVSYDTVYGKVPPKTFVNNNTLSL